MALHKGTGYGAVDVKVADLEIPAGLFNIGGAPGKNPTGQCVFGIVGYSKGLICML